MNRLDWIQKIKTLKESGLYNKIRVLGSPQGWLELMASAC